MEEIDPKVLEIVKRLKKVDQEIKNKLFILVGICIISGFYFDNEEMENGFLTFLFVALLLGGIVHVIISTVKAKKAIGQEFGLVCSKCGRVTKSFFLVEVMKNRICPNCGANISLIENEGTDRGH